MKKNVCLILLIFLMFSFCACGQNETKNIANVNGEEVTSEELDYFRGKLKAEIMNDFLEEYDAEYTEDFWNTQFGGTTPQEELDKRAFEECVTAKIQLIEMKKEKIYDDISYKALYNKALEFNKENEDKEGVVGIKTIQLSQFYTYYLQNGVMELENIFAENKLKADEKEIEEKAEKIGKDYPDRTEEEIRQIAKKQIENNKFESYINNLRKNAVVKKY